MHEPNTKETGSALRRYRGATLRMELAVAKMGKNWDIGIHQFMLDRRAQEPSLEIRAPILAIRRKQNSLGDQTEMARQALKEKRTRWKGTTHSQQSAQPKVSGLEWAMR
jgi:hypothetical protein